MSSTKRLANGRFAPKKRARPTMHEIDLLRNRCASQEQRLFEATRRVEKVFADKEDEFAKTLLERDKLHQANLQHQLEATKSVTAQRDQLQRQVEAVTYDASRLNTQNRSMWHLLKHIHDHRWICRFAPGLRGNIAKVLDITQP